MKYLIKTENGQKFQIERDGNFNPTEEDLNAITQTLQENYSIVENENELTQFQKDKIRQENPTKFAEWQKRGQMTIFEAINKLSKSFNFLDKIGQAHIENAENKAKLNEQRQGVNRNDKTKRYEIKGVDRAGNPLYNEIDLTRPRGFTETLVDVMPENIPFVGQALKAADDRKYRNIVYRLSNNQPVSDDEIKFYNFVTDRSKEFQVRGITIPGQIAQGLAATARYGVEFYYGGLLFRGAGGANLARGAGIGAKKALVKAGASKGALNFGANAAAWATNTIGAATAKELITPQNLFATYEERRLDDQVKITPTGKAIFIEAEEKPATAFFKSLLGLYITDLVEIGGGKLLHTAGSGGINIAKNLLNKNTAFKKLINYTVPRFTKFYEKINNMPVIGKSTDWLKKRVAFDGLLEEMGEESLESALHLLFGINNEEKSLENYARAIFKTPEEWAVIVGTIALYGGSLSATGAILNSYLKNSALTEEEANEILSTTTEKEKEEFVESFINDENSIFKLSAEHTEFKNNLSLAGREDFAENDARVLQTIDTVLRDKYNENGEADALIQNRNLKVVNMQNSLQAKREAEFTKTDNILSSKKVVEFDPKELKTDARTFQYKSNSDENGVTERLQGIKDFDPVFAGNVIVYETKEGEKYIVDGHQRLALTKRLNNPDIKLNGFLFKEVDGYTKEEVRTIAAQKNIAEGSGTAIDTAKIIKEIGVEKLPSSLPRNSSIVRNGILLSRLGDEAFEKVINEVVTPQQGAVIADIIRNDKTKQSLAIDAINSAGIENLDETALMAREVLASDTVQFEQSNLFGKNLISESVALDKIKIINRAVKQLKKDKNIFSGLKRNKNKIEKAGNILLEETNEGLKEKSAIAIELIENLAFVQGDISNKANELASAYKNNEINFNDAVMRFIDFVTSDNILSDLYGKTNKISYSQKGINNDVDILNLLNDLGYSEEIYFSDKFETPGRGNANFISLYKDKVEKILNGTISKVEYSRKIKLGVTPSKLVEAGARPIELDINPSVIKKIKEKHNLSTETIKNIPELLHNPVAIFKSFTRDDSIVALIDAFDSNENPIIVAIELEKNKDFTGKHSYFINQITSVYGKNNFKHFFTQSLIEHKLLKCDKNKIRGYNSSIKLQLLQEATPDNNIISDAGNVFNPEKYSQINISGENRAEIEFGENETLIKLFQGNDASSVVHELAHLYLHDMQLLAKTNKRAQKDLEEIYTWLKVEKNHEYDEEEFRYYHEKFARGFEAYLMNGQAPTSKLKNIFAQFKEFLKNIYTSFKDLDIEFSQEVKMGFDRLFTTDEEYEKEVLPMYQENYEVFRKVNTVTREEKFRNNFRDFTQAVSHWWDTLIIPIDTRLKRINPELEKILKQHTFNILNYNAKETRAMEPFLRGCEQLKIDNEEDFNVLDLALKNRDVYMTNKIIAKHNLVKEFEAVKKLLDDLYTQAVDVGIDVGFLDNYFPRLVDFSKSDALLDYINKKASQEAVNIRNQIIDFEEAEYSNAINALKKADPNNLWNSEDKAKFINTLIRGFGKNNILISRIGQLKFERQIEKLTPELNAFYRPFTEALAFYVPNTRKNIEERRFFGGENIDISKLRARIKLKRNMIREVKDRTPNQAKFKEITRLKYELSSVEIRQHNAKEQYNSAMERLENPEKYKSASEPDIVELQTNLINLTVQKKRLENQIKEFETAPAYHVKHTVIARLHREINEANSKINEIMGNNKSVEESIGNLVASMAVRGDVHAKDEMILRDILMARFSNAKVNGATAFIRDIGYIGTLNDITNAITQFGDLALSAYKFGLFGTIKGMVNQKITKTDLGIDTIANEFQNPEGCANAVNKILKWIGLEAIDGFGKNTVINASIFRAQKLAKKNDESLTQRLNFLFGNEAEQVKQDLINGSITDAVLFIAFNDLAELQPITMDQMSEIYAKGGIYRMFYMLKTYSLKTLDIVRNDTISKIQAGIKKDDKGLICEGLKNLVRLQLFFFLFGIPKDWLVDLILNRETNILETCVDNLITSLFLNRYFARKLTKEGLGSSVLNFAVPPLFRAMDVFTKDAINIFKGKKSLREAYGITYIPFIGKIFYGWLGGSQNKNIEF